MNEHQEQVLVCQYLNLLNQKYTAIVNGFFGNKNFGMIAKFKREGWNKGLPDLFIILNKNGNTQPIFIEMKAKKQKPKRNGKGGVSDEQKEWIDELNKTCIKAFVCYGFEEAKLVIDNEMKKL